ncbi:thioredoxin-domain-containing protein [Echria macrotheca]|uniref:Protein disulfide-isomerase n=1 Tax=Echria macrotheca TaxID=438768 RepID=A0AAJ0B663_9PEZI|nr:thioredoxin-domain-containing protein [Echria macrotheca]
MSHSDSPTAAESSQIRQLDDLESLDKLCQAQARVLLSIVHRLIPACGKFTPIYEEVASSLAATGADIIYAQIDCGGVLGLGERFGYRSFPSLYLCQGPHNFKKYYGPLRKDDILGFLARQDMPTITHIDSTAVLAGLRKAHNVVVVAYTSPEDRHTREIFAAAAESLHDDFVFCIFDDGVDVAPREENNTIPSVVVYKNSAERKSVLINPLDSTAIQDFVNDSARPLIMELLPELHQNLLQEMHVSTEWLPMARKYQGLIQLLLAKVDVFPDLADKMHVKQDQWPAFAIRHPSQNYAYPLSDRQDPQSSLGPGEVGSFIETFLAGQLRPTIKSQPIPVAQEGPVVEVVGLSYDDVVLDPKKDLLVEFYTPWCGPCKALLPRYQKLAFLYTSDEKSRDLVTIAKLEYEGNDVPDTDIRGFPWFKLYPAGKKESPVTYKGEFQVAGWAEFIAKEGTHGVHLTISH